MSKLNEFFEKKKQRSKGLGDLIGSKKPIIGGLKSVTGEPSIPSVISEVGIDDWSAIAEPKEASDSLLSNKNLSSDGLRKSANSQMVVAVKTSKPDFDSNIWKAKSADSSGGLGSSTSSRNSGENGPENPANEVESEKPKETLKYNVRARMAARGQKVDFPNAKEVIKSMPTLAAAVANVNKSRVPCSGSQAHANTSNCVESNTLSFEKETSYIVPTESNAENGFTESEKSEEIQEETLYNENQEKPEASDLEVIKQLRSCNLAYFNKDVLFNCIVDIEQSKLKYSKISRDF
ncbi:hypothetical protein HWI79_3391 [Cryptosporidium felis]|nr:hypothetical protein HWI79_3391 [Cryptosporidium felis]